MENMGIGGRAYRVYPFVADGQTEYMKSQEYCILREDTSCDLENLLGGGVTGSWCPQGYNRPKKLHLCSGACTQRFDRHQLCHIGHKQRKLSIS